jgi:ABC-type branched-subunit amino acid transport system ATPase component
LRLRNITHAFSTKRVLDNVSLDLEKGKIYVLMGVNGSGKSTLFNIISGYIKPQAGNMFYGDEDTPVPFGTGLGVGFMARTFQDLRLILRLTVRENVLLAMRNNPTQLWYKAVFPGWVYGSRLRSLETDVRKVIENCSLTMVENRLTAEISFGEQKLLGLASCMANDPCLLLLDEPVAAVSQECVGKTANLLRQLRQLGKTILLIEHNTDFSQRVADEFLFLSNGKLNNYRSFSELVADNKVLDSYI